jgi:hypothetical protein
MGGVAFGSVGDQAETKARLNFDQETEAVLFALQTRPREEANFLGEFWARIGALFSL